MRNFLSRRKCFIELQGFRSKILYQEPCSVLQGTKNSGTLYNLYNLKVVYLARIMYRPILYKEITGRTLHPFGRIDHSSINFVDDSTSVIGLNDHDSLKEYLENFL